MMILRGGAVVALSAMILLSMTAIAPAQTFVEPVEPVLPTAPTPPTAPTAPTRSDILPYLLDYPGQSGQVVEVRCVQSRSYSEGGQRLENHTLEGQRLERRSLQLDRSHPVTVEVQSDCREVLIRVQTESTFDAPGESSRRFQEEFHERDFNRSWLTRIGSGWWLLRR